MGYPSGMVLGAESWKGESDGLGRMEKSRLSEMSMKSAGCQSLIDGYDGGRMRVRYLLIRSVLEHAMPMSKLALP